MKQIGNEAKIRKENVNAETDRSQICANRLAARMAALLSRLSKFDLLDDAILDVDVLL